MTFEQLKYLCSVMDLQNFTEAAEKHFVSQPTISRQLKALGEELNIDIFEKGKKPVLTPAGECLYAFAGKCLNLEQELKKDLAPFYENAEGVLKVGTISGLAEYGQLGKVLDFYKIWPGIRLCLIERPSSVLINMLESNEIELAFMDQRAIPQPVSCISFSGDIAAVLVSESDPLAKRNWILMEELKDRNIIARGNNSDDQYVASRLCSRAGFAPKFIYSGDRYSVIAEYVRRGLGVGIVFQKAVPRHLLKGLKFVGIADIRDKDVESRISLLHLKDHTLSSQACVFWNYIEGLCR